MRRLRAGRARLISRTRSFIMGRKESGETHKVPAAQSCSCDKLIDRVGSTQRSNVSPQRATTALVIASATITSVLSGRCGPCCSIAPMGRHSTDAFRRRCDTSVKVSSPINRVLADMNRSAADHAQENVIAANEMVVKRSGDVNNDQKRNSQADHAVDEKHGFRKRPIRAPDRWQLKQTKNGDGSRVGGSGDPADERLYQQEKIQCVMIGKGRELL